MKLIMERFRKYHKKLLKENFYDRDYEREPLTDEELQLLNRLDDAGKNARVELLAHIYDKRNGRMPTFKPRKASDKSSQLAAAVKSKISSLHKSEGGLIKSLKPPKPPTDSSKTSKITKAELSRISKEKELSRAAKALGQKQGKEHGYSAYVERPSYHDPDNKEIEDITIGQRNENCWKSTIAYALTHEGLEGNPDNEVPFFILPIENDAYVDLTYKIYMNGQEVNEKTLFLNILQKLLGPQIENEEGELVGLGSYGGQFGYRRRWDRLPNRDPETVDSVDDYSFCPIKRSVLPNYNLFRLAQNELIKIILPHNEDLEIEFTKEGYTRDPLVFDLGFWRNAEPGDIISTGRSTARDSEYPGYAAIYQLGTVRINSNTNADPWNSRVTSTKQHAERAQDPRTKLIHSAIRGGNDAILSNTGGKNYSFERIINFLGEL